MPPLNFIAVVGNVVFFVFLAVWRVRLGPPWVDQLNVLKPFFSLLFPSLSPPGDTC